MAETGKEIPERLTQYTRRVAKRIVEYLIKRKRTENAAKFIKMNLLSPNAMESLHRLAVGHCRLSDGSNQCKRKENLDEALGFSLTIELWKDMRRMKQMNGIPVAA